MLAIDDNMAKLLKMKEKLLEISSVNRNEVLEEYRALVTEIDSELYRDLYDRIKNANINKLSLEEQLEFLTDIKENYEDLYEFQCGYKSKYAKYSNEPLELSDMSKIFIARIEKRISDISGYLINSSNLAKNKKLLESLNMQLIQEEKKKLLQEEEFSILERELRENVINAEGRIYNASGEREFSSIREEYEKIGINLKTILGNREELEQKLSEFTKLFNSAQEDLNASEVCYVNMPTDDTKKLYNDNLLNVALAKYKMTLLEIAKLISQDFSTYGQLLLKRNSIKRKIDVRLYECLNELHFNVRLDPFGRIKLDEQIQKIESIGNIKDKIAEIREQIQQLVAKNEELIDNSSSMLMDVYSEISLLDSEQKNPDVTYSVKSDSAVLPSVPLTVINDISSGKSVVPSNKVINIKDVPNSLKLKIVRQKSTGVVSRVMKMIDGDAVTEERKQTVSPQLVIEKKTDTDKALFSTESHVVDVETNDLPNNEIFNVPVEEIKVGTDTSDVSEKNDEEGFELPVQSGRQLDSDDDLFQTVVPFETPALFNDRYDDVSLRKVDNQSSNGLFVDLSNKDTRSLEDTMPELFWVTQDDEKEDNVESNALSFDEQINALVSDNDVKVKKLAA